MNKASLTYIIIVVIIFFAAAPEGKALTYEWNQISALSLALETNAPVDISSNISSSGCVEISEYLFDPNERGWYVTVTNYYFTLNDAIGGVYSWHLEDMPVTYFTDSLLPETGKVLLDIHLYSNNKLAFWSMPTGSHDIYCEVGYPGFPFALVPDDFGNINLFGVWLEKPSKVPEAATIFLLVAGLIGVGVVNNFKSLK